MQNLLPQFDATLAALLGNINTPRRVWIGFSGGLDSTVLAHLASRSNFLKCNLLSRYQIQLCHVHHGLQPAADDWAQHAQRQAKQWSMEANVLHVDVAINGESVEAAARQARYDAWAKALEPNDVLLLGHHADDQVETVLQRWCRGAGSAGLAGIPAVRALSPTHPAKILRPLLSASRAELAAYADAAGLEWIEDPSNDSHEFDRNFLRHKIVPELKTRWPELHKTIARNAALQADTAALLTDLAALDVGGAEALSMGYLSWENLSGLTHERQANVIYHWLRQQPAIKSPSQQHIQQMLVHAEVAKPDAEIQVAWPGAEVRFWQQAWHVVPNFPVIDSMFERPWPQPEESVTLPGNLGHLNGMGITDLLTIRFRRGGETIRVNGQTKLLKKYWQQLGVMPWCRAYVPLIYAGDELLAVGDLVLSDRAKEVVGLQINWQPEFAVTM